MTNEQARQRFRLKNNDNISKKGVLELIASTEKRLKVWSLSRDDRAELEKDLEALKTLL